jgi:DNA-binding transcriptional regulator YdaS (Cro superfamily)
MPKVRVYKDPGLSKAIEAAGGVRALARALKCAHTSILQWTKVPYRRLLDVERVTGMPREELRPELYRK